MEVKGTAAIVTGGASGLGEACVRMLVNGGGKVVILDLVEDAGKKLAEELGDSAIFVMADVTNEEQVQAAVDAAKNNFGGLHICINCAGISAIGKIVNKGVPLPLDQFTRAIDVNLTGTFNVSRLAAAAMTANEPNEKGERGVIINTASVAAFEGQIGQIAYAASKGGVVSMTLVMARDLSRDGIRVVTIAPGIMDTPMLAGLPDKVRASLGQQVPFPQRLGTPAEYADLAKCVIENGYLNGETIRLDGAMRMGMR
nr:3-hydroxyacyl-CoA dehydrogenase [Desulfobacterales bacterium]